MGPGAMRRTPRCFPEDDVVYKNFVIPKNVSLSNAVQRHMLMKEDTYRHRTVLYAQWSHGLPRTFWVPSRALARRRHYTLEEKLGSVLERSTRLCWNKVSLCQNPLIYSLLTKIIAWRWRNSQLDLQRSSGRMGRSWSCMTQRGRISNLCLIGSLEFRLRMLEVWEYQSSDYHLFSIYFTQNCSGFAICLRFVKHKIIMPRQLLRT